MLVIIVNGMGRCGKDYLISHIDDTVPYNINYVQKVKDMLAMCGYKESTKSDKDRKFLHKLKILTDEYCDFCFTETLKNVSTAIELDIDKIIFIHVGELKDIKRLKGTLKDKYKDLKVYTLWIDSKDNIGEDDPRFDGNKDNVDTSQYDYVFINNKDEESVKKFNRLIRYLL